MGIGLVVLSAQGGHHNIQELLARALDFGVESRAQLRSKDDDQAVSEQLEQNR